MFVRIGYDVMAPAGEGGMVEACERLRGWWAEKGAERVTRPASEAQVRALESRHGITLPDDFRAYLLTLCPASDTCSDGGYDWWGFDRIKSIPDAYKDVSIIQLIQLPGRAEHYLFFVDFVDRLWTWAISCTSDGNRGRVALVEGPPYAIFVADSFTDFVERYCDDQYDEGCPSLTGGERT